MATSRSDVAGASGASDSVARWTMALNAENYGLRQRRELYRNLSRMLPPELLAIAHERERDVLQQLSLPLEIRRFFDALPRIDRSELARNAAAAVAGAVDRAHSDAFERTVVEQIAARGAVKPAAVVWALIKPHGRLSADVLRGIEDPLADADPTLEDGLGRFVNEFIAARNLRQGADGSLAYYHGKVEAGFEGALAARPQAVRRTLATLIDVLLARDDEAGGDWGLATAADILRLSRRIPGATPMLGRASQDRIDRYVEAGLDREGGQLDRALAFAAEVGSSRSVLAELARWLQHRPVPGFPGLTHWGRPERDVAWHARMRADPAVAALAFRFVRTVLPTDSTNFEKEFASDLAEVAGDLSHAFVEAALASVDYGFIINDGVIAAGALVDLNAFETVVDAAVAALTPTPAELERAERDHMVIVNEEVSEDYAEHLSANGDGVTAQTYLTSFVEALRTDRGPGAVLDHRHFRTLRPLWLRLLTRGPTPAVGWDEVDAAVSASFDTEDEEALWSLLARHWDGRRRGILLERIVGGSRDAAVRRTAIDCLLEHAPETVTDALAVIGRTGAVMRVAELALDLGRRSARRGHDGRSWGSG